MTKENEQTLANLGLKSIGQNPIAALKYIGLTAKDMILCDSEVVVLQHARDVLVDCYKGQENEFKQLEITIDLANAVLALQEVFKRGMVLVEDKE